MSIPPEAALIRDRRKNRLPNPALSLRAAAAAASAFGTPVSEAGWRSIEGGKYVAKPEILAAMASAVGVTPAELDEIGARHQRQNAADAAVMLRAYLHQRAETDPALSGIGTSAPDDVLQMIVAGIDDIRKAPGLTKDQKESLEKSLIDTVKQTVAGQLVQIRTALEIARGKGSHS
ncbi:hypothetical protein GCM10022419_033330 [Nonomuraea rosea]|uniref:XRE family transcriptional regulator n=1 Tax=Nonomuraea rosea TaxID=638574 RepID=A0ABP6WIW4_9ACTN